MRRTKYGVGGIAPHAKNSSNQSVERETSIRLTSFMAGIAVMLVLELILNSIR
jgi:hypothetical protein